MKIIKWRVIATSTDAQTKIRIPTDMLEHLKEKAAENSRSFNSELIARLARTLYEDEVEVKFNNKGGM